MRGLMRRRISAATDAGTQAANPHPRSQRTPTFTAAFASYGSPGVAVLPSRHLLKRPQEGKHADAISE